MDTINDRIEDYLGLTEESFLLWGLFTGKSDMPDWLLRTCIALNDRNVLDPLKEMFWDEYVEEMVLYGRT